MIKRLFSTLIILCSTLSVIATDYTALVNPLMGTMSTFEMSAGNTYPAIARPWGMNHWTVRTAQMGDGWKYNYSKYRIYGFEQTHQPSPWIGDYGQVSLMPVTGRVEMDEAKRASHFSHKAETALPHCYKVYLADYDVTTEFTPTERAAVFQFTYPEGMSYLVVDAYDGGSEIKILPRERRIIGYSTRNSGGVPEDFKNYFVIEFDHDFEYTATYEGSGKKDKNGKLEVPTLLEEQQSSQANHTGAVIGMKTRREEKVTARIASSFVSAEQALLNLEEVKGKTFEEVKSEGCQKWNEVLGRVDVKGGSETQRKTFYTCLYRSLLFPRIYWEIDKDGNIIHRSPYNGKVEAGYLYTDTGFWDTFRSLFPLLNLLYPSENLKMQEGLINAYKESGFFPEWASPGHRGCMVGNNSASVLADAYLKGIKVEDVKTLYEGLVNGTKNVHPKVSSTGRLGHEYYNKLGYVPCDVGIHENAARTLEYAYNDWCILQLAKALKRPKREIAELEKRTQNYQHLFRKDYNLMCGKKQNGEFERNFSPLKWGGNFTEGNSWHYTWSVFHDPAGLINLMGGKENFVAMLDSVFAVPPHYDDSYYGFPIHEIREMTVMNMGNYAHGNQPIQHMIYLYNYAGAPWKAQYRLREVMDKLYSPTPDGYCGDEDNGQTSAWYVFSALGFYPVCPGTDQYIIGTPLFDEAVLHFENGKDLRLSAKREDQQDCYIQRIEDDGREYSRNYFTHEQLQNGGNITFQISALPNKERGTKEEDLPYSMSRENLKH